MITLFSVDEITIEICKLANFRDLSFNEMALLTGKSDLSDEIKQEFF